MFSSQINLCCIQELIGLKNDMSLVEMIAMTNSLDVQEVIEMKTQVLSADYRQTPTRRSSLFSRILRLQPAPSYSLYTNKTRSGLWMGSLEAVCSKETREKPSR